MSTDWDFFGNFVWKVCKRLLFLINITSETKNYQLSRIMNKSVVTDSISSVGKRLPICGQSLTIYCCKQCNYNAHIMYLYKLSFILIYMFLIFNYSNFILVQNLSTITFKLIPGWVNKNVHFRFISWTRRNIKKVKYKKCAQAHLTPATKKFFY